MLLSKIPDTGSTLDLMDLMHTWYHQSLLYISGLALQFPAGEVDAADLTDEFDGVVKITIVAKEDNIDIGDLIVVICRHGELTAS